MEAFLIFLIIGYFFYDGIRFMKSIKKGKQYFD